jgi:hypothetical protein
MTDTFAIKKWLKRDKLMSSRIINHNERNETAGAPYCETSKSPHHQPLKDALILAFHPGTSSETNNTD